jgi:hypothetical protein
MSKPPHGVLFVNRLDPARADSAWRWKIIVYKTAVICSLLYRQYASAEAARAAGRRAAKRFGISVEDAR